jgi:hypothetical protein
MSREFYKSFLTTAEDLLKVSAAKGHWRTLKPTQMGEGRYGEKTVGKTWVDREESEKSVAAKKVGRVPSPSPIAQKGDFIAFAVPGGNILFLVHKGSAQEFMTRTSKKGWEKSSELRKYLQGLQKQGKFGIFQVRNSAKYQ